MRHLKGRRKRKRRGGGERGKEEEEKGKKERGRKLPVEQNTKLRNFTIYKN